SASVKRNAFADQPQDRLFRRSLRFVADHDQPRLFIRPLGHAPESAHFEFFDLVRTKGFAFQAHALAHLARAIGKHSRRKPVAGLVDQLAGKVLRFADDASLVHRPLQFALVRSFRRNDGYLVHAQIFALAAVGIGIEIGNVGALADSPNGIFRSD